MKNKLTPQKEGTIFLFIVSSVIWFIIFINNHNSELLFGIIGSLILGLITTIVLGLLFVFMKATFKW